ncbi:hypothetical protein WA026_010895 [Henosepilachna vigintioctopunctata]|uniref:Elongation factor EFG domain-containing protein n=1 Tax=Henosepilachna vigintioctopunctata TaxID=420089 RepID=A0AAW1USA6_9CUCU
MTHNDTKIQIKAILEAWKPLADTILQQCSKIIDPPSELPLEKIQYLLNQNYLCENQYMNECIQSLVPYFKSCSSDDETPVILYVSKMFCVNKKNLSQNKPKVFVPKPRNEIDKEAIEKKIDIDKEKQNDIDEPVKKENEDVVVAFARVFTGTLKKGQELYVLLPGYVPNEDKIRENLDGFIDNNKYIKKVKITEVYMLQGRELILVQNIPAGNICAIRGLESAVIRTATLSSSPAAVPFIEQQPLEPVVRNVIEPVIPTELPILRQGLKQLMQSDSCVQVITQETGELVLLTSGDVHLEKCLEDLTAKFADIKIHVSSPMVSLRETIIHSSKKYDFADDDLNTVTVIVGPFKISVIAVSLPNYISIVVKQNYDLLRMIEEHTSKPDNKSLVTVEKTFKSQQTNAAIAKLKEQLKRAFCSKNNIWNQFSDKIWSVGRMNNSINLLFNGVADYKCNIYNESLDDDIRSTYNFCITNAFNYSCKSGPLCEEPLMNCAFIVKKYEIDSESIEEVKNNRLNAQTIANIQLQLRSTFREAIQKQTLRLMEPIFTTDIQVNTTILGKVYSVISRRHGKVMDAVGMDEQEKTFLVKAQLPVVESVGFANEIRKTTSGQAMPNLKFSHYEIIDGDPFYEPVSDDEDEEGIDVESAVRANKLRKEIRRRKGLYVDDQIVVHAEKQRTLNKKK